MYILEYDSTSTPVKDNYFTRLFYNTKDYLIYWAKQIQEEASLSYGRKIHKFKVYKCIRIEEIENVINR